MVQNDKYPSLFYDPTEGKFFRESADASKKILRLLPDVFGTITYRCYIQNKVIRKKGITLAYELLHGSVPVDHVVYAKDMNVENLRGYNIGCVKKTTFLSIKDALRNTNGAIRLIPHKTDAYVYTLKYRENGKVKTITVHDIVEGLKLKRKILLRSLKIIGKYIVNH